MPIWIKRSFFLFGAAMIGWIEGYYIAPLGTLWVAAALLATAVLAIWVIGRRLPWI
jgi:hypothetical protein